MIARLKGRIEEITPESVVLDCNGIGFRLLCSAHTRAHIRRGEETVLQITTQFQAQGGDIRLYAFANDNERACFNHLIGVQGVGGKLALAVLSAFDSASFVRAITEGDAYSLQQVSGLGARTAKRLITELTDKLLLPSSENRASLPQDEPSPDTQMWRDLEQALENLGFERTEVAQAIARQKREGNPDNLDAALRTALKDLSPATGDSIRA